jgi:cardiolipin synthase A/B
MWIVVIAAVTTALVIVILLNFRKPEKTIKHRVTHLHAVETAQFKREMGLLLGPTILSGNQVTPLQNGDEIFPAMLSAIRKATSSITFETYIYWSGQVGEDFAGALIERARAGVLVHVMLDWVGSQKIAGALIAKMKEAGIKVERYHPLHWYSLGRMNNRTHRKVLVVDGAVAFTGGVGIADQWSGHAQDPDHWRDSHFQVVGPVVAQFQAAFLDNWIKTTGNVLHGEQYFPALREAGNLDMQLFMSSPAGGSSSMRLMYLSAITAATRAIDIQAAYFVPDSLMVEHLIQARERNVRIRILLPDKHLDSATIRIASKKMWGPLLESGAEVYLYEPTMLHCKMLIFDRYMVSVGSTNFDMRSFELNDEASLNVYDGTFANEMTEVFESDLKSASSYSLDMWRRRPRRQKIAESILIPLRSQL